MVALNVSDAAWSTPPCPLPVGIPAGIVTTLLTSLSMEFYGPARLAVVRS